MNTLCFNLIIIYYRGRINILEGRGSMGIVRNCINIVGITPENQLPKTIEGQLIEASETENIYLGNELNVKNINQIIIDVDIKGTRVINAPLNKIIVVDGFKKVKASYYNEKNNEEVFELESPMNFFIDIDKQDVEIESINVHIADAYFHLTNKNILYNHILYIIDVPYSNKKIEDIKITKRLNLELDENEDYKLGFIDDNSDIELEINGEEQVEIINVEKEEEQVKEGIIKELLISEDNKLSTNADEWKIDDFVDIDSEYL